MCPIVWNAGTVNVHPVSQDGGALDVQPGPQNPGERRRVQIAHDATRLELDGVARPQQERQALPDHMRPQPEGGRRAAARGEVDRPVAQRVGDRRQRELMPGIHVLAGGHRSGDRSEVYGLIRINGPIAPYHLVDGGVVQVRAEDRPGGKPDRFVQENGHLPGSFRLGGVVGVHRTRVRRRVGALADDAGGVGVRVFSGLAGACESAELLHVPRGVQVGRYRDRHVAPYAFYLLQVPQGEGVVVAVGEEKSVRLDAHEEVVRPVPSGVVAGPAGPAEVEDQRDQSQSQYRRRHGQRAS